MEKFWDANHEKLPQLQKVVKMLEGVDTSQGGRMIPEDQRPAVSLLSPVIVLGFTFFTTTHLIIIITFLPCIFEQCSVFPLCPLKSL